MFSLSQFLIMGQQPYNSMRPSISLSFLFVSSKILFIPPRDYYPVFLALNLYTLDYRLLDIETFLPTKIRYSSMLILAFLHVIIHQQHCSFICHFYPSTNTFWLINSRQLLWFLPAINDPSLLNDFFILFFFHIVCNYLLYFCDFCTIMVVPIF